MKFITLFIFAIILQQNITAQKKYKNSAIRSLGAGYYIGLPRTFESILQINFRNNNILALDEFVSLDRNDLPADYHDGLCLFGNCTPEKQVNVTSVLFGRHFKETKNLFLNIYIGVALVHESRPVFTKYDYNGFLDLSSNYTTVYKVKNSPGFTVIAREEWKISPAIALNLSAYTNINSNRSIISPDAGLTFELFRNKFSGR